MECRFVIGVVFMSLLHLDLSQVTDPNAFHVITSPQYPKTYPKGAKSLNPIKSSSSLMRIKLTVSELNLPDGDSLLLYDDYECGDGFYDNAEPFRELIGTINAEEEIIAATGSVCLKLSSNIGRGLYKILWSEFPTCNGTLTGPSGDIISPGYPYNNYPVGKTCKWEVKVPKGQRIRFTILDLDIKDTKKCADDRLEIKGLPKKEVICGSRKSLTTFTSTSNTAELSFHTRARWVGAAARGFWLKYEAVGCLPLDDKFGTPIIQSVHYTVGQKYRFKCPDGQIYQSGLRDHIRICQEDNQWHPANDTCVDITCAPPTITPGVIQQPVLEVYPIDSQVVFSCDDKLSLVGSRAIVCTVIGDWNTSTPTCPARESCPILSEPHNGHLLSVDTEIGGHAEYTCDIGYKLNGTDKITCQLNGVWDSAPPLCSQITCSLTVTEGSHLIIEQMDGESHNQSQTVYGSRVWYKCEPGFELSSESKSRQCGEAGSWDGEEPTCKKVQCLKPDIPLYGYGHVDNLDAGSEVDFGCDEGHTLVGPSSVICQEDGTWSAPSPICTDISCPPVYNVSHVMTDIAGGMYRDNATVVCESGWFMDPQLTLRSLDIVCTGSGNWSVEVLSCDFEDAISTTTNATVPLSATSTYATSTSNAATSTSTTSAASTTTSGAADISTTSATNSTSTTSATSTFSDATDISTTSTTNSTSTTSVTSTAIPDSTSQTQTNATSEPLGESETTTITTYFISTENLTQMNLTVINGGDPRTDPKVGAMKSNNTGRDIGIGFGVLVIVVLVVILVYFILKKRRASPDPERPQETFENPTYNIAADRKTASNVELGKIRA